MILLDAAVVALGLCSALAIVLVALIDQGREAVPFPLPAPVRRGLPAGAAAGRHGSGRG